MQTINRSALLVRPKEPYLTWAANVDDGAEDVDVLSGKTSVYLVAQDPDEREESAPIEDYSGMIFEAELEAWYTDENRWPKVRNHATFLEWFDVEAKSLVWDLERSPIGAELDA